jgi:phage shock protein A
MKENIETAKSEKDQMEGQLTEMYRRMKEEFGVTTIKQAQEKVRKLNAEADKLEETIIKELAVLENKIAEMEAHR